MKSRTFPTWMNMVFLPSRTYPSAEEIRQEIRDTTIQRRKNRVTVVLIVNADRSHAIPVTFIRHSKTPPAVKRTQFT